MRRPLLVVLGLFLVGLSAAAIAANKADNAEDIHSFTTEVSISVPTTALPPVVYLVGDGSIALTPPSNHNTTTKDLVLETSNAVTPLAQADPSRFFTFRSAPAPSGGFLLQGFFHLYIDQNRPGDNRFTALLLDCPASEPIASTGCTSIAIASADAITPPGGNGFKERVAHFGSVSYTIPQGRELRIKVVNQRENPGGLVVSTADPITISFGYLPARQSRLERTATP